MPARRIKAATVRSWDRGAEGDTLVNKLVQKFIHIGLRNIQLSGDPSYCSPFEATVLERRHDLLTIGAKLMAVLILCYLS